MSPALVRKVSVVNNANGTLSAENNGNEDDDDFVELSTEELNEMLYSFTQLDAQGEEYNEEEDSEDECIVVNSTQYDHTQYHDSSYYTQDDNGIIEFSQQDTSYQEDHPGLNSAPNRKEMESIKLNIGSFTSLPTKRKNDNHRQTTMTQHARNVKKQAIKEIEEFEFQNTDKIVHYITKRCIDGIDSETHRIFKVGESFRIVEGNYSSFICNIQSFHQNQKSAIGTIYRQISKTFIGKIDAKDTFRSYLKDSYFDKNQYVYHDEDKIIPLCKLGKKIELSFDPFNNYVIEHKFHVGEDHGLFGIEGRGFCVSYTHIPKRVANDQFDPGNAYEKILVEYVDKVESAKKAKRHHVTDTYSTTASNKENMNVDENTLLILDVFAGIGGMSQGFHEAGVLVPWAVEKDAHAAATFRANHPDTFLFNEDIEEFLERVEEVIKENDMNSPYFDVLRATGLHGSPPCQAFSLVNTSGGKNDEYNARMTLVFIRVAKLLYQHSLKCLTMENVPGLLRKDKISYLNTVACSLIGIGMDVMIFVVDSSRYGDPQRRNRLILQAVKRDLVRMHLPVETHGRNKSKIRTCKDAIGDLSRVNPSKGNGIVRVQKTDGTYSYLKDHSRDGTQLKSEMEELQPNEPSHTIRRKDNVKHYERDTLLTVRESARLQSFPDSFEFFGSSRAKNLSGIGNAVPVKTAKAIGLMLRDMWDRIQNKLRDE